MKDKFLSWSLVLLAWLATLTVFVFMSYPVYVSLLGMVLTVPGSGADIARMGYLGITLGFLIVAFTIGWMMGSVVYRLAKVDKRPCLIAVRSGAILMLLITPVFTMGSYQTLAPFYDTYVKNFWSECYRLVQPIFGPIVSGLFPRRDTLVESLFYSLLASCIVLAGIYLIYGIFHNLLPWWRNRR